VCSQTHMGNQAYSRAGGGKAGSAGQAKRSPGKKRQKDRALKGRQKSLPRFFKLNWLLLSHN
jgi:hypothetical protein